MDNAIAFIEKVSEDAELYAIIKRLEAGNFEHLQRAAAAAGFAFSSQEWLAAVARLSGPLSDDALDGVSGGALYSAVASASLPLALRSFGGLVSSTCGAGGGKCDSRVLRKRY